MDKKIKTTDWLIRGIPKEQLEREKQEAIMSADLEQLSEDSLSFDELAKKMFAIGYRKQREGKWIFHKDGSGTCNQCKTTQLHIWDMDNFQSYCGHCGAKMKGGAVE